MLGGSTVTVMIVIGAIISIAFLSLAMNEKTY